MTRKQILSSIVVGLLAGTRVTDAAAQNDANSFVDGIGTPTFTTISLNALPHTTNTVPHWTSAFTSSQTTYPFSMVGTNPALGSATTTVPVAIIPIALVFGDDNVLDATPTVANVLTSPIFQNFNYTSGTTQFGDAIVRAEFWTSISTTSPDWHVLLGTPTVYPTRFINIPAGQGVDAVGSRSHILFGEIDVSWFADRVNEAINDLHIDPTTLPIVHTYNLVLTYDHGSCCYRGYHFAGNTASGITNVNGNGNQPVQTGIWESWVDPRLFTYPAGDVDALSHEVSEWLNDPFVNNLVPSWQYPSDAGCQGRLEVGDYIAYLPNGGNSVMTLSGLNYHIQNEALLPWFSRETPSTAIGGAYSYPDTTLLTSPSQPCP